MTRDWLDVTTRPRREPGQLAAQKYRNRIVTLLIEQPRMQRGEIQRAIRGPRYDSKIEAELDSALTFLVRKGELHRPYRGTYMVAAHS